MPNYTRFPTQSAPQAFELPDDRYLRDVPQQQVQESQGAPPSFGAPAAPGTLADVEGQTDQYYDTWSKLNSFAQSMWNKGVDVTQPDPGQPGGGIAFKTFQKLAAHQMTVANRLGNELKEQTQMRPYIATGQTLKRNGEYQPTQLLPEVEALRKALDQPFYTKADADRALNRLKGPALESIKSRYDLNDPYIQDQMRIAEGFGTTHSTHPYFFQQHDDKEAKEHAKAVGEANKHTGVLKRVAALSTGYFQDGKYDVADMGGKIYAVSNALNGMAIDTKNKDGKKVQAIIRNIRQDSDGKVELTFEPDAETGEAPAPERIDNQDAFDLTARLQQFNKLGSTDKTAAAIEMLGYGDTAFGLNKDAVFKDNALQLDQGREQLKKRIKTAQDEKVRRDKVEEALDNGKLELILPNGKTVTAKKNFFGSNFEVKGFEGEKKASVPKEYLLQLLEANGYFKEGNTSPKDLSNEPTPIQSKAQYLMNKYK